MTIRHYLPFTKGERLSLGAHPGNFRGGNNRPELNYDCCFDLWADNKGPGQSDRSTTHNGVASSPPGASPLRGAEVSGPWRPGRCCPGRKGVNYGEN